MTTNWQIEDFLTHRNGRLHIDGVDAVELAREHGTPLFVFSESRIRHNIERLKKVADVIDCPLKLCYAAKAMSTMGILKAVKDAGCDIEVNSGGELWKALKAGFTGDQINFNGNSKEIWELELAISNDVYAIQVDSLYELSLIEETANRLGKRANCSLRMVPEIESGTHSGLQTALLTSKFGMMPDEAFGAFRDYGRSPHLDLCGIHLHIGSQNPDPGVYTQALELLTDSLVRIHDETGTTLRHLNLGGGFPINYVRGGFNDGLSSGRRCELHELAKKGHLGAQQFFEHHAGREMLAAEYEPADALGTAWNALNNTAAKKDASQLIEGITLLLEPGRSVIADAAICLSTVRNTKQRPRFGMDTDIPSPLAPVVTNEGGVGIHEDHGEEIVAFGIHDLASLDKYLTRESWLLTDAGFNILLSMETYKWYYHLISAERADEEHNFPYKVAGPLCDGGDVYFDIEGEGRLPEHRLLPVDVEAGEVLALLNTGAYTLAQASQYNGRFLPAVLLIGEDGDIRLIRKRDSFEDLINNDIY